MKTSSRFILSALAIVFFAILSVRAQSQATANAPLQVSDVPPETQRGSGPERYSAPVPAKPNLPTLWLIGDSTVRNGSKGDNGPNGQWGWGAPITAYFDLSKINVVNRALGGTSSRSFYDGNLWKDLKPLIKKGDFVMIQFGANDNGDKGALKGVGEETEMKGEETVHTYGWYLKQYIAETRAQGATPIICSLTPRKRWSAEGKFQGGSSHAGWAEQIAKETNTSFVPLQDIISNKYEELGKEKVDTLYVPSPKENLHTGWDGAVVNAECVISGLKALPDNLLGKFFSKLAQAIAPWQR
jgi:rhamnogalacturonan acetylesterase